MSITIQKIIDSIPQYDPTTKISENSSVKCCMLFNKNFTDFKPSCLYIGYVSELPKELPQSHISFMLIKDDKLPADPIQNGSNNFIFLNVSADLSTIFNTVQELFSSQDSISAAMNKMIQALMSSKSVQYIIDTAHEIFGNPVILCDPAMYIISHSVDAGLPSEHIWETCIKNGYAPEWTFAESDNDPDQVHINEPSLSVTNNGKNRIMHAKIRTIHDSVTIAYLLILEHNRKFTDQDLELMPMLCNILAMAIQRSHYSYYLPESMLESFIISLIENENHDQHAVEWRAKRLGWNPNSCLYVMRISLIDVYNSDDKVFYYKKMVQYFFPSNYTLIHEGNIVVIIDRREGQSCMPEHREKEFKDMLIKNRLHAGVSNCFSQISDISKYYHQANKALELGFKLNKEGPVYYYKNFFIQHMFDLCSVSDYVLKDFCSPPLLKIIEYDNQKDTTYALSLYMYLKNCQDIQKTSQALHVHYNTLKYRLQRLQELFEIDLSDSELIFNIWFSFLIIEYRRDMHLINGAASYIRAE